MNLRVQRGHDSANWETCMCGEPGCGSHRPLGGTMTRRELEQQAEDEHLADLISDRWDDKHLG